MTLALLHLGKDVGKRSPFGWLDAVLWRERFGPISADGEDRRTAIVAIFEKRLSSIGL